MGVDALWHKRVCGRGGRPHLDKVQKKANPPTSTRVIEDAHETVIMKTEFKVRFSLRYIPIVS